MLTQIVQVVWILIKSNLYPNLIKMFFNKEVKEGAKTNRGYKIFEIWTKFMLDKKTFYFVSTEKWVTFIDDKLREYDIIVPNFKKWLFSFSAPDEINLADFLKTNLHEVQRKKRPTTVEGECSYVIYYRWSGMLTLGLWSWFEVIYTLCYKNKLIYKTSRRQVMLTPTIELKK